MFNCLYPCVTNVNVKTFPYELCCLFPLYSWLQSFIVEILIWLCFGGVMVSIIVEILGSSLITLYAGNGCNNNAWCVFDKMSQKDCIVPLMRKIDVL